MTPTDPIEAWERTVKKLEDLLGNGRNLLAISDFESSKTLFGTLCEYSECHYCKSYRLSLTVRSLAGACQACPIHRYSERLCGRKLSYNGCYHFPQYDAMVRIALMFQRIPTRETGKRVLEGVEGVLRILKDYKEEFLK